ncbi:MAG: sugar ABC transporter ATP-binding protein [Chloroflexi bacterium 13_1_40CM_4_65_16]|nr:MAG: sugar ABC transporter ATP-binding protein [Chloroflexi bacterium 13_1_40CM_4_65_16]
MQFRIPPTLLVRIGLIIAAAMFVLPFYWMANSALKDIHELSSIPPTLYPHVPAWDNFWRAVTYIPFGTFLTNSIILTTGVTIGSAISNPLIAYGFSRIRWPGRDFVFGIVMASIFLPFPVLIVALFDIFAKLQWVDTFLPIIVPAFFGNPFFIFLMRQYFLGLPMEISEQARIDGANEFQVFLYVIMPLAKPAVAVVIIFAAVQAWGEFLTPLLFLQAETKYPLSIGLQFYRQSHDVAYNLLMAASTLIVLPIIALFLVFQRFFIQGVTAGSLKG